MPALAADGGPQAGARQAPIAEHAHGQGRRHGRPQPVQQGRDIRYPGPGLAPGLETPSHGQGQAPVDHAHDQGHQVLALGGGVDGQGQLRPFPPGQDPAQERCETGVHIQLHPAGRGLVGLVMEPLAQTLAGRVLAQVQGQQGSQDGVPATAAGQDGPTHPQGQALDLAGP